MEKGSDIMGKTSLPEEHNPRIVPFSTGLEQAEAAALARYWDARLQGRPAAPADLDPELLGMVQLLEYYRDVTGPLAPFPALVEPVAPSFWQPAHYAALIVVAAALLLFASNTLLSPRSWLLSSATDPDWIPWVSDDWLGGGNPTAERDISQETINVTILEDHSYGA